MTSTQSLAPLMPRWFLAVLAACAVAATAAFVYRAARPAERWVKFAEEQPAVLDTRTGTVCVLRGGTDSSRTPVVCLDLPASGRDGQRVYRGRTKAPS